MHIVTNNTNTTPRNPIIALFEAELTEVDAQISELETKRRRLLFLIETAEEAKLRVGRQTLSLVM